MRGFGFGRGKNSEKARKTLAKRNISIFPPGLEEFIPPGHAPASKIKFMIVSLKKSYFTFFHCRIIKVFAVFLMVFPLDSYADGPCEKTGFFAWVPPYGSMKTCMLNATVIDSTDFLITSDRDETVKGFYALNNKNLEFLPKNIGEKFPNLLVLQVGGCSVKAISKEHFKGLTMLQGLAISNNQLETIDDDTFDHIPAVVKISLCE